MSSFKIGPCHTSTTLSIFFPLCKFFRLTYIWICILQPINKKQSKVALGQAMTPLNLNWIWIPNRSLLHPKDAYRISIGLTMFWITFNCLIFYSPPQGIMIETIILWIVSNWILYLYYVSNIIRSQLELCHAYRILPKAPGKDSVLGRLFPHFVIMQMLRHTCDYDTYSGLWFQPVRCDKVCFLKCFLIPFPPFR